MRYLLDTDIVSDLVRDPKGRAATRLAAVGDDKVATSIVVASELRYGAAKRGSARLNAQLDAVLTALPILALDAPADVSYAEVRCALEAAATPIGGNDILIAAHALAMTMIMVTANEREFTRVPGLKVENWLR
jgi:tRNA(fMet)-specific endonuclease VapC